jgi:hypothetical protein
VGSTGARGAPARLDQRPGAAVSRWEPYAVHRMALRRSPAHSRPPAEARPHHRDHRNRLRPVGAPAPRHLRRGGPHLVRAAGAEDGRAACRVEADRLLRRHGRPPRSAAERAEPRDAEAAPRQAAHVGARPVRPGAVLRPLHEQAPAGVPRLLRVPLRLRLVHRAVPVGTVQRRDQARHGALRRDPRDVRGNDRGGEAGGVEPVLPGVREVRAHLLDPGHRHRPGRARPVLRMRHPPRGEVRMLRAHGKRERSRRGLQARLEGRLGSAVVRPRDRLRDARRRPAGLRTAVFENSEGDRRRAARDVQVRAVPRREGQEDLEETRQRRVHRAVAEVRTRGLAAVPDVRQAAAGEEDGTAAAARDRRPLPRAGVRVERRHGFTRAVRVAAVCGPPRRDRAQVRALLHDRGPRDVPGLRRPRAAPRIPGEVPARRGREPRVSRPADRGRPDLHARGAARPRPRGTSWTPR